MTPTAPLTPPLKLIQAALLKTTETLAHELAHPTDTTPDWSDFDWRVARAVAAIHGVSPLLSLRLRWKDSPSGWQRFLAEQRAHTLSRHRRIEQLLQRIDEEARKRLIPIAALKGAELHARGLYAAGERPMADVDLLVQTRDMERTSRMIESLRFRESGSTWKHRVFVPEVKRCCGNLGEHEGNTLKIDLHERISEALPISVTEITRTLFPRLPHPGLNPYPTPTALMIHLLLHAAGAMTFKSLRLLQLHDIALLSTAMAAADWDRLLAQRASLGSLWWALPVLRLTHRYYPNVLPKRILEAVAEDSHWLLDRITRHETLSEASFSYLWIEAFPGIAWAQSPGEMWKYVASRLLPSKQVFDLRRHLTKTHLVATASEWEHLSQAKRVARWLTARQARSDTLYAVRTALSETL